MAHLTNFSFEFFYEIFTEDASLLFLCHGAKKAQLEYTAYLFTLTILPIFSMFDSSFLSIFDFLPELYYLPFYDFDSFGFYFSIFKKTCYSSLANG